MGRTDLRRGPYHELERHFTRKSYKSHRAISFPAITARPCVSVRESLNQYTFKMGNPWKNRNLTTYNQQMCSQKLIYKGGVELNQEINKKNAVFHNQCATLRAQHDNMRLLSPASLNRVAKPHLVRHSLLHQRSVPRKHYPCQVQAIERRRTWVTNWVEYIHWACRCLFLQHNMTMNVSNLFLDGSLS